MFTNYATIGRNLEAACKAHAATEARRTFNLTVCPCCGGHKEPFTPYCGPACETEAREEREAAE